VNLLDFFRTRKLIEKVDSSISGEVRIFKVLGKPSMVVGGLEQSGAFIGGIWKKALKKVSHSPFAIRHSLILGLGGGTVAQLVNKFWPDAKMVGVEIDPAVIRFGKKYFNLDKISNLEIVNADAVEWVEKRGKFDLILIDVYLADKVPQSCETEEFLRKIKRLLSPSGLVIFNRLFYKEKKEETREFIGKLEKIFSRISFVRTSSNLLTLSQK